MPKDIASCTVVKKRAVYMVWNANYIRIETHPLCGKYLLFQPVKQVVLFFYHAQRLALIVRDNAQQISSYF